MEEALNNDQVVRIRSHQIENQTSQRIGMSLMKEFTKKFSSVGCIFSLLLLFIQYPLGSHATCNCQLQNDSTPLTLRQSPANFSMNAVGLCLPLADSLPLGAIHSHSMRTSQPGWHEHMFTLSRMNAGYLRSAYCGCYGNIRAPWVRTRS